MGFRLESCLSGEHRHDKATALVFQLKQLLDLVLGRRSALQAANASAAIEARVGEGWGTAPTINMCAKKLVCL